MFLAEDAAIAKGASTKGQFAQLDSMDMDKVAGLLESLSDKHREIFVIMQGKINDYLYKNRKSVLERQRQETSSESDTYNDEEIQMDEYESSRGEEPESDQRSQKESQDANMQIDSVAEQSVEES